MWSRNQRQSAARLFLRRLLLLALLFFVAFGISSVWKVYKKERESAERRIEAERERIDLEGRQAQLESDLTALRSDRGLEETLREQFALAESGEKLIVIVDAPAPEPATATSTIMDKIRSFFWFW